MYNAILFISFSALLVLPNNLNAQTQGVLSRDEYAVYAAVISEKYIKTQVKLVVITTPTCCAITDKWKEQLTYILQPLSSLSPETFESYLKRNRKQVTLRRSFELNVEYRIVNYHRIEKLFDMIELEEDWKTFHRKYPDSNGYIRFSRVGFNQAGDQALVSTGWMCGSLCGEGRYLVLLKKNGRWKVENDVVTWVS